MRMLFFAHSGVRYLVLLAGLVALGYFAYAVVTKRSNERLSRTLGAVFVGLLDLQILLGIALVALGLYYPALMGHLFMMIAAAVVGHAALALARSADPPERRNALRLGGVVVSLTLIVAGILAIGRAVFGNGSPTML